MENQNKNFKLRRVTLNSEQRVFVPNENELACGFLTIQDWLFDICDKEDPDKSIAEYQFILYQSYNEYTLYPKAEIVKKKGKTDLSAKLILNRSNGIFLYPILNLKI
jgi:hypothetical protein